MAHKSKNINTFNILRGNSNASMLGDELALADNFNESFASLDAEVRNALELSDDMHEPFRIQNGCVLFLAEGEFGITLNLNELTLRKNDICVIAPGSIWVYRYVSEDCRIAHISYSNDKLMSSVIKSDLLYLFQQYLEKQRVVSLSPDIFNEVMSLYAGIRETLLDENMKDEYKRMVVMGYFQIIVAKGAQWVVEHLPQDHERRNSTDTKKSNERIFENFMELVRKNCKQERSLSFYADKLCLTPKYMSTCILQSSGKHAKDWVRDYVILEAKIMLRDDNMTVQQVAEKLSFPTPSFFGKYFKAATGVPPRAYKLK